MTQVNDWEVRLIVGAVKENASWSDELLEGYKCSAFALLKQSRLLKTIIIAVQLIHIHMRTFNHQPVITSRLKTHLHCNF